MLLLHNARIGIPNNAGKTAASVAATTYLAEIIRNPRFIQTRTQMEVLSMSPAMNDTSYLRAKAMGNAMATATGGTANLLSLTSSTKIGVGLSLNNAAQNSVYSPAMNDPATLLLADAYGQNYTSVKNPLDTWKQSSSFTMDSNAVLKPHDTYIGEIGFSPSGKARSTDNTSSGANMISTVKIGKNDINYADPSTAGVFGMPEVNEYGNIYMPPKLTSAQEMAYQQYLRGESHHRASGGFSTETGTGTLAPFDPAKMTNTLFPAGYGDFHRKTTSQYQLREQDPGFIYSYSHFAETHKIALPLTDGKKSTVDVDLDTENFARAKFGPVPSSFRGCTEDLFFKEFNIEDAATEGKLSYGEETQRTKDIISERLRAMLDAQGLEYDGEEIDALLYGKEMPAGIRDRDKHAQFEHIKFELAKLRNKLSIQGIPAQAAHTPTAFDTTEEWMGVRDYLWLLGQPNAVKKDEPKRNKLALLKALAKVMDETHRIFCDPFSLAQTWQDPLGLAINNVNNYSKSDRGTVRGGEKVGETRRLFLQASSAQMMKSFGEPGATKNESSEGARDTEESLLPRLNNSNIVGGNAFQGPESPGIDKKLSTAPVPPNMANVNQFIFSSQRKPSPAKGNVQTVEIEPKTLAEAADVRLSQLCKSFVADALEVLAPPGGWPGNSNVTIGHMSERITKVLNTGMMSDDLCITLRKLLEAASKDVVLPMDKRSHKQLIPLEGNFALIFPPRQRRVLIDNMYEIAAAFMKRAEVDFPLESMRAHLWAHNGRKQFQRYKEKQEKDTDMSIWLRDLHLEGTIVAFKQLGFKELSDFLDLTLENVQEYFPFLKIGDAIRMARNIKLLTPELLSSYARRAFKQEIAVSLPPIPNLQPASPRKLSSTGVRMGPTPSRKVKVKRSVDVRPEKTKKPIVLDREPTREEYLSGIIISDYYLNQLQLLISKETDGANVRLASDLGHANMIIRKKGLAKQVIAKHEDGKGVIVRRAMGMKDVIAALQDDINQATKGIKVLTTNFSVANELVREAGLMGSVLCQETPTGICLVPVTDIDEAISILQDQVAKATKGFQLRMSSDLDKANEMIRESGLHGIVVARENHKKEILLEKIFHEEIGGDSHLELHVNSIATHGTLNLGTLSDKQDPCVKIYIGKELVGKTHRAKDAGANATFDASFHMHLSQKMYEGKNEKEKGHVSVIAEVFNESLSGALTHLGKGSLNLQSFLPPDKFNEYVSINIPLYYTLPEVLSEHSKKQAVAEILTDVQLSELQLTVTKETKGINLRLASDLQHAANLIAKKGWQHLVMPTYSPSGDIILTRIDGTVGSVTMKVMLQRHGHG